MPNLYKEKEMEIRNIVKEQLDRGKVEMCIYFDNTESDKDVTINKPVTQYFNQLLDIANELGIEADKNKILQTVMRFPDTLQIKSEELEDTEWEALEAGIKKALEEINKFRLAVIDKNSSYEAAQNAWNKIYVTASNLFRNCLLRYLNLK